MYKRQISDFDHQPLLVHSHLGSFAITGVGKINNAEELMQECFEKGFSHFLEMSNGNINQTEIVAALINQKEDVYKRQPTSESTKLHWLKPSMSW